jgi:DnaK suppressor protein
MSDQNAIPDDEYLTSEQVMELKALLEGQLESLLAQGRMHLQETVAERETDADALDLAVTESNREYVLRLADRERRLMKKIQGALTAIANGDYGTCEGCGGPIDYKRLLARPVARLCIDCKTEAEQLEGRRQLW